MKNTYYIANTHVDSCGPAVFFDATLAHDWAALDDATADMIAVACWNEKTLYYQALNHALNRNQRMSDQLTKSTTQQTLKNEQRRHVTHQTLRRHTRK